MDIRNRIRRWLLAPLTSESVDKFEVSALLSDAADRIDELEGMAARKPPGEQMMDGLSKFNALVQQLAEAEKRVEAADEVFKAAEIEKQAADYDRIQMKRAVDAAARDLIAGAKAAPQEVDA